MRRQAAIRIDLVRRERQDRARRVRVRQPFERGEEEPRVGGELLDVGVGRDDDEHDAAAARCAAAATNSAFAAGVSPDDARRRHIHAAAGRRRLQQGAKVERGRGGHETFRTDLNPSV